MRLYYAAAVDCAFNLSTIIDDEMISKLGTEYGHSVHPEPGVIAHNILIETKLILSSDGYERKRARKKGKEETHHARCDDPIVQVSSLA